MGGVGGRHALGRFAGMSWMDELAISLGPEEGRVFPKKGFAVEICGAGEAGDGKVSINSCPAVVESNARVTAAAHTRRDEGGRK